LLIAPLILLAACETTVEVWGVLGGSEALTGSATLYDDGGTIELSGNASTHCLGNFDYRRRGSVMIGEGTMMCDDRRVGRFTFIMKDTRHGSGFGSLNGTGYRFSF
jgi:hypothetical protein